MSAEERPAETTPCVGETSDRRPASPSKPRIKIELSDTAGALGIASKRFAYGRDCRVFIVLADGTKEVIPNVQSVSWRLHGRTEPCLATVVLYAEPPDVEALGELVTVRELLDRLEKQEQQLVMAKRALEDERTWRSRASSK